MLDDDNLSGSLALLCWLATRKEADGSAGTLPLFLLVGRRRGGEEKWKMAVPRGAGAGDSLLGFGRCYLRGVCGARRRGGAMVVVVVYGGDFCILAVRLRLSTDTSGTLQTSNGDGGFKNGPRLLLERSAGSIEGSRGAKEDLV